MHRFYLPPQQSQGDTLFLTGAEAHHGIRVLRLRRKDKVTVLNGTGTEFLCEVEASDRDKIKLAVLQQRQASPAACRITLLVGIPKGKILESIIQKVTELGASRIVPMITERVMVKLDEKESSRKAAKWQQIAIEAIKQSGAPWLPQVEAPVTPSQFLERKEQFELSLVASLQPGSKHPREYFDAFRAARNRAPHTVSIWVGPEGDFAPSELNTVRAASALPITLGSLVLRVETATVYCLSVVNYEVTAAKV